MPPLQRDVIMPDGSVRNVHTITRITHLINEQRTMIDIESTKEGIGGYLTQIYRELNLNISIDEAYAELSLDPAFEEYVDVAQEALNDLLPTLTDEQAELIPTIFPEWTVGATYLIGMRVRYNNLLYRCVQDHVSQETYTPDMVPALWSRTTPEGTIGEWIQPTGAQDAYALDDKVKHNSKIWISTVDNNVWEPGVYGWEEFVE